MLDRIVAIKVLADRRLHDEGLKQRFEREARTISRLNHPHICSLHDIGQHNGVDFLVMEYLEGESLANRLTAAPPLAIEEVLRFAIEIAESLSEAHRLGIVHRDLKPGNVMITRSGVKLLDFGLAKFDPRPGRMAMSGSTVAAGQPQALTAEGTILGTWQYMAPEQLQGKDVDSRADIFAFGAVVYEMATGTRAFAGDSHAGVIAAILERDPPPISATRPIVPAALDRVVQKCLAKNPDARWQTTRDLADQLKWIADEAVRAAGSLDASRAEAVKPRAAHNSRSVQFAALALSALVLAGYGGWRLSRVRESPAAAGVTRFAVQAPAGTLIDSFDMSPDGTTLTYLGRSRDAVGLFIRRLDQFRDSPIAGSEGASSPPLFSPDGQWVAFFSGRRLLKVNVQANAAPILISENIERWLNGATWLADGSIIVARANGGLLRVPAEGGEPVPLTSLSETPRELDHHSPTLLPGDKAALFTVHAHDGQFNVVVETLATAQRKLLIESAYDARYLASGHLVFARNQAILAVPFDLQRLELAGPPVTLVEPVAGRPLDGNGGYRLSTNGTLAFLPQPPLDGRTLTWVERAGAETPLPIPARAFSSPSVSPDGTRLAFAVGEAGRHDIYTYELATGTLARLTRDGENRAPIWTRDGRRVTYSSSSSSTPGPSIRDNGRQLVWQSVDSPVPERLVSGGISLAPGTWSADGRVLVYTDGGTSPEGSGIFALPLDDGREPQQLVDGSGEELEPSFSPDGRWLAYVSTETGRFEVFVAAFPDTSSRRQITVDGGRAPKWSRDGRELVYRSGGRMFAVPLDTTRGVSTGKPQMLFDASGYVLGAPRGSGVLGVDDGLAPDGRFLMVKPGPEEQAPPSLHVVLNWVSELNRRVPR
jgi:serine/threonine-protein kinase